MPKIEPEDVTFNGDHLALPNMDGADKARAAVENLLNKQAIDDITLQKIKIDEVTANSWFSNDKLPMLNTKDKLEIDPDICSLSSDFQLESDVFKKS